MILGQRYTYYRIQRWRDDLPRTPEACDQHLFHLKHHRHRLKGALIDMDQKIEQLEVALAAERTNPTSMWFAQVLTSQNNGKAALERKLKRVLGGRAVLRPTDRRGVWLVIFKDKDSAALARTFGVVLFNDGPLSQIGETVYQPPNPWP